MLGGLWSIITSKQHHFDAIHDNGIITASCVLGCGLRKLLVACASKRGIFSQVSQALDLRGKMAQFPPMSRVAIQIAKIGGCTRLTQHVLMHVMRCDANVHIRTACAHIQICHILILDCWINCDYIYHIIMICNYQYTGTA